jgi:dolichol-phosphate mannosyltransferase
LVIVVLPAYNEAEALPSLLGRLRSVSVGHFDSSISVIVVDDGSTDGTGEQAKRACGLKLQVLTHKNNLGLNEALRTGLLAALEMATDDDIIVTMDADDTHTPGLISRMSMAIEEGNDVVIASRYVHGARVVGVSTNRRLLSLGASMLFRIAHPIPGVRDYTCGYRAYRAQLLQKAFARWGIELISEPGFSCMVDILLKLSRLGAIITEVPVILRYDRKPGKTKMNIRKTALQTLGLLVRRRFGVGTSLQSNTLSKRDAVTKG